LAKLWQKIKWHLFSGQGVELVSGEDLKEENAECNWLKREKAKLSTVTYVSKSLSERTSSSMKTVV